MLRFLFAARVAMPAFFGFGFFLFGLFLHLFGLGLEFVLRDFALAAVPVVKGLRVFAAIRGGHARMSLAAQLRANDLPLALFHRAEPHRRLGAWYRVLVHAHLVKLESMDHVE